MTVKYTNIKISEKGLYDLSCRKEAKFSWIIGEEESAPTNGAMRFLLREMRYIVEIRDTLEYRRKRGTDCCKFPLI